MDVSLNDTETRYFSDLFLCCDEEKTGKIPTLKATELYRSANLADDVINEITSLAGIPESALHISRAQFYSCLKLIAAHQAAMPLRQELIAATVQLPLPRFSWKDSPPPSLGESTSSLHHQQHNQSNGFNVKPPTTVGAAVGDRRNSLPRRSDWQESAAASGGGPHSRRNSSTLPPSHREEQEAEVINSDVPSTDSEVEANESSCGGGGGGGGGGGAVERGSLGGGSVGGAGGADTGGGGSSSRETHRRRGSPEAWSTNSDSPTPTNSVAERPWAKETLWQGLLGDEHRQLLGTEEESSDRHSSDDDNETDLETVYQITPEQREYYYKQFKAVQHDVNGLLSGQVARVFFEKSRIPVEELRHIWQLCDVTRDGALSLAEFTAAMHLVVLRRYNIPLPATLPACLYPSVLDHASMQPLAPPPPPQEPPEADLLHLNDDDEEDNTDNTIVGGASVPPSAVPAAASGRAVNEKNVMNMSTLSTSSQTSTGSRQGAAGTNHSTSSLTPPALPPPVKQRSMSNSPSAEGAAAAGASSPNLPMSSAVAKTGDRALWTSDVPPTQWTKFTESPTAKVSSPGPKPVNFDMQRTAQAVVSDPQILHPVPLRVTPVANAGNSSTSLAGELLANEADLSLAGREVSPKLQQQQQQASTAASASAASHHRDSLQASSDLRAIQRPQAKKLPAKNIGALPPPPQRESSIGSVGSTTTLGEGSSGDVCSSLALQQQQSQPPPPLALSKKEPPPLPPPRPHRHGRSSSLDLNKFKMSGSTAGQQPEMTAQASFDLQTSTGFADFSTFDDDGAANADRVTDQQQHSLPAQQTAAATAAATSAALTSAPIIPAPPPPLAMPPTRLSLQSNQRVSAFEVYRKPQTPRNSQSPSAAAPPTQAAAAAAPPLPVPFGAMGAAAIAGPHQSSIPVAAAAASASTALLSSELYERRVNAISDQLRHVSFRQDAGSMADVLRHLREQNNLLLRLCNDLSDELLTVQTRKEELRVKLDAAVGQVAPASAAIVGGGGVLAQAARTGSSISAPVTANVTGGSGSSGVHSNV